MHQNRGPGVEMMMKVARTLVDNGISEEALGKSSRNLLGLPTKNLASKIAAPPPPPVLLLLLDLRGHDAALLALLYECVGAVAVGEDGGADERREHHVLGEEHVSRARRQLHHVHQLRHHVDAEGYKGFVSLTSPKIIFFF